MTSETVSFMMSGIVAVTGIAAGVILPLLQRRQLRSEALRQERLRAYSSFVSALSEAELAMSFLHRDDPDEPFDDGQVQHLDRLRYELMRAHNANVELYLLAPYLLALTAERALREVEARSTRVLSQGDADIDPRWWESTLDQMRDDLGTVSRIPSKADLVRSGWPHKEDDAQPS